MCTRHVMNHNCSAYNSTNNLTYWNMWEQMQLVSPMSFNNSSSLVDGSYEIPKSVKYTLLILYVIIMVFALGGNAIVCYTVLTKQRLRTVTNFFIVSLAISDIIMTLVCVPLTLLSNMIFYYWPFGSFMCPFVGYFQLMTVILRAFTLVAITCDRHYVIWRPLEQRLQKLHAKIIIICLWIAAAITALPTAVHSKIIYLPYEPGSHGLCIEYWDNHNARYAYSISIMLLQYFVPLFLMMITYIHIGVIIWIKRPPGEADQNRDLRLQRSKRKTVKMLVAVVSAYALSWMPLHVITLAGDINPSIYNSVVIHMTWLFAHWLAFSNCATNPVIYCWMNSTFRSALRNIVCFKTLKFKRNDVMARGLQKKTASIHRSQSSTKSEEKAIRLKRFNFNNTASTS